MPTQCLSALSVFFKRGVGIFFKCLGTIAPVPGESLMAATGTVAGMTEAAGGSHCHHEGRAGERPQPPPPPRGVDTNRPVHTPGSVVCPKLTVSQHGSHSVNQPPSLSSSWESQPRCRLRWWCAASGGLVRGGAGKRQGGAPSSAAQRHTQSSWSWTCAPGPGTWKWTWMMVCRLQDKVLVAE